MITYADIERGEAEAGRAAFDALPTPVRQALGATSARVGGAAVQATRHDPGGPRNVATGLGADGPVDADVIAAVLGFFRDAGVTRATLKIADPARPVDGDRIRRAYGLTLGPSTVRMVRPVEPVPTAGTTLRIAEASVDQYPDVVALAVRTDFVSAESADVMASFLRRDNFHAFAAWDGPDMVALSVLRFFGDYADLVGSATLLPYRRRGAQTAFVAARAACAREHGARTLLVETAQPPNTSHNNMLRAGFRDLYVRHQWIWHADPPDHDAEQTSSG
ncbi:hypothetical protein Val02_43980 [Virgisporangium aliadipatigenens]|uniref:N-acetyltransferase domain-containing protein n=1 Tax=Virgisporangium aliadipatigenens TaxID=741659 RepID=A0A8J3YNC4_9ACTN|nr:hypothetical protein [Virgisporangium aliadipatigenens]GIJ47512.1 hypothetical protein Val02_43980 [Virgisporangium aliadipatigenens]